MSVYGNSIFSTVNEGKFLDKIFNRNKKNDKTVPGSRSVKDESNSNDGKFTVKELTSSSKQDFEYLYNNEAFCAEGMSPEDGKAYEVLNKYIRNNWNIGNVSNISFYHTTGKVMNDFYHLTGDNKYPNDLNIIMIDWSNFPKSWQAYSYKGNFRYFSDVVYNNAAREIRKNNKYYENYR